MDLRSTLSAVVRLPFDADKLANILCESEPKLADAPGDQSTFWLVIADQFAKRSIVWDRVRDKALQIIDSGTDIAAHHKLGMNSSDLRKRQKMLIELRRRITGPAVDRSPRPVLQKPQTLLMDVGDVFAYPTFGGRCINAYAASRELDRHGTGTPAWKQDGWAAMVIVDRGRAFDFLAWYRPLTISKAITQKPTLEDQREVELWRLAHAGTCSPLHFRRMELENVGTLPVDIDKLRRWFPADMVPGIRAAVSDISICNGVSVAPYVPEFMMPRPGEPLQFGRGRPHPTILSIAGILST